MTIVPGPAVPTGKPVAWSYSAITMFENCPRKFYEVRIAKNFSDANQWNAAGDTDHQDIANYLQKGIYLPSAIQGLQPLLDKLKFAGGTLHTEKQLALDQNFQPCGTRDWNNCWVRGAGDLLIDQGDTIRYFDWKRGKYRPSDEQIELTSLLAFQYFPNAQRVVGGLVFYNANKVHPHAVNKADAPLFWNGWISRAKALETAVRTGFFPTNQNPLCGWCPVRTCQFNTNKNLPPQ
jgi:hypothetical protein